MTDLDPAAVERAAEPYLLEHYNEDDKHIGPCVLVSDLPAILAAARAGDDTGAEEQVCRPCGHSLDEHNGPGGRCLAPFTACSCADPAPVVPDSPDLRERARSVLIQHDAERMECSDHVGLCCPAGDAHDFDSREAHQADAVLAVVRPDEQDRP